MRQKEIVEKFRIDEDHKQNEVDDQQETQKQDNNKRRRGNRRDGTGAQEIKDNIYHGNYRAQMVHR